MSYILCYVSDTSLKVLTIFNCKALLNILFNVERVLYKCGIIINNVYFLNATNEISNKSDAFQLQLRLIMLYPKLCTMWGNYMWDFMQY